MKDSGVRKALIATSAVSLITAILPSAIAAPASQLITCVEFATGKERISKTETCRTTEATAKWRLTPTDSALASGGTTKSLTVCSNKENSPVIYQIIRAQCARHQLRNLYSRSAALAARPVIAQAVSFGHDRSQIALAQNPATNPDAPIAYYTITSSRGDTQRIYSWKDLSLVIGGLQGLTTYTFTVTATTADGTSPVSASSLPVTTPAYVPPTPAPTTAPLAAPAFTLSASAETKTVNTAITGYAIASTGGTIASYAISPAAPTGLIFNTTTGVLSGTPTSTQSATVYTITATNASGSATQTFTLAVNAAVYTVGQMGPGGGTIFYVALSPFACGPTRSATCTYLEAAPSGWNGGAEPSRTWAQSTPVNYQSTSINNASSPETATATAIGWGYRNTRAIILQGNSDTATSAAALTDSYTVTVSGVEYDDWYLPSKDELNQMCKWQRGVAWISDATVCSGGITNSGTGAAGFVVNEYWSSTEGGADRAWGQLPGRQVNYFKNQSIYVRPIRAF